MRRTLKEWRVHKDLTQLELAKKAGVPVSTYNFWERNTDSIKIGNIQKICEALEISPQDVLFFKNESHLKCEKGEAK